MTVYQQFNGLWVVTLPNGRIFTGMNKESVIEHANEWLANQ